MTLTGLNAQQPAMSALDKDWTGLRADIELHEAPPDDDGRPAWVIEDPVSGRFFRIGEAEACLVEALLRGAAPSTVLKALRRQLTALPSRDDVRRFLAQLNDAGLCKPSNRQPATVSRQSDRFWVRLLHGYVYYRIPLCRPDAWLTRLAPAVRPLAGTMAATVLRVVGVLGLLLAIPQAALYFTTVSYLLTPLGLASFLACLVLLKIGHELAHAFSAKLKGLHVRSMGITFILLWPVLYTDVTDAWRLPERRMRAQIGSAGIRFELAIAGTALLAWSLLPDGALRSLAFYLSSASIVSTLLINLNPFMRFDGYYLLMDLWGIDNLQPRSFALLRYRLRRTALGWRGRAPERHPQAGRMCLYAAATIAYRVFIAIVIAAAVLNLFGALVGLAVALLESYILILRPLLREYREIRSQREAIGSRQRMYASLAVLGAVLLAVVLPLDHSVTAPALIKHERLQQVRAPFAGRIAQLPPEVGSFVEAGQTVLALESAEWSYEHEQRTFALQHNEAERLSLGTRGSEGAYRNWLETEAARLQAAIAAAQSRLDQRVVVAALAGEVIERVGDYRVGDTVAADTVLATLRQSSRLNIQAYVDDRLAERLQPHAVTEARLHPWNTALSTFDVSVASAHLEPVQRVPSMSLFDRYGGPLVAAPTRSGSDVTGLRLRDAHLAFSFTTEGPAAIVAHIHDATPAWIELELQPTPLIWRLVENIARMLSR